MELGAAKPDECFIVVKAQPHRSSNYFETVCCAGVGRDGKWRRQYPVPFRILNESQRFSRWSWISYKFTKSSKDRRPESQKVQYDTLRTSGRINEAERSKFLNPLLRNSFSDAEMKSESLALIRPSSIRLTWKEKKESELSRERHKHAVLANQASFFDPTAKPLRPCRMQFFVTWTDPNGLSHRHECDDWETSSAYNRFEHDYGHQQALEFLQKKYEEEYFNAGLALAFSTHSRRNVFNNTSNQWLLVGIVRLNPYQQSDLFLSTPK